MPLSALPPLALTMGEPGGIGPDITLAVWRRRAELGIPPFYLLADPSFVADRAALLGLEVPIATVDPDAAAAAFHEVLPVVPLRGTVAVEVGHADPGNAQAVVEAIARAVGDVRSGAASAIVTNPISKQSLYAAASATRATPSSSARCPRRGRGSRRDPS
jgi:4-hydroxythreonine-4-phosphate dehydrogenase